MCHWTTCVGSLLWLFVMVGQPWAVAKDVLLKTDLEENPLADGWKLEAHGGSVFDGAWEKSKDDSDAHHLVIRRGYWQSPPVAVGEMTDVDAGGHHGQR